MDELPTGIRRTRDGKHYLVNIQVRGQRRFVQCAALEEAVQVRADLHAELLTRTDPNTRTLHDALEQTKRERWNRAKSKVQLTRNGQLAVEYFGKSLPASEVTRSEIAAYDDYLRQKGNTDATINRKMAALSTILQTAYEHGWITSKPVIHRLREGRGRIRYLTLDEERLHLALYRDWGKRDHHDVMCVFLDTGMRMGELWALQTRDVNFHTGVIHIFENKTSHPRSIPMTTRVRAILEARSHLTQPFPYDNFWFQRIWNRARTILGFGNDVEYVPYACRHTCATRLLQRGMTIPELQLWLGHKSIHMTMRYAHLAPTALLKGAQLLEQGVTYEVRTHARDSHHVIVDSLRQRTAVHGSATHDGGLVPGMLGDVAHAGVRSAAREMGDGESVEPTGDGASVNPV